MERSDDINVSRSDSSVGSTVSLKESKEVVDDTFTRDNSFCTPGRGQGEIEAEQNLLQGVDTKQEGNSSSSENSENEIAISVACVPAVVGTVDDADEASIGAVTTAVQPSEAVSTVIGIEGSDESAVQNCKTDGDAIDTCNPSIECAEKTKASDKGDDVVGGASSNIEGCSVEKGEDLAAMVDTVDTTDNACQTEDENTAEVGKDESTRDRDEVNDGASSGEFPVQSVGECAAANSGNFESEGPVSGEYSAESTGASTADRSVECSVVSSGESGAESAAESADEGSVDGIADEDAEETSRVTWACETAFDSEVVSAVETIPGSIADVTTATSIETNSDTAINSTANQVDNPTNTADTSSNETGRYTTSDEGYGVRPQTQSECVAPADVFNAEHTRVKQEVEQMGDVVVSVVLSLPIDSLHCIASFLSPSELSSYGQTCKVANRVCCEIFRRVRMHGFRCATEVVSAWKFGEHADAREIAALYIQQGVPIYPHSLGHSYHTVSWRMGVEAKEMTNEDGVDDRTNPEEDESETSKPTVDKFYSERPNFRTRNDTSQRVSYLEEKCLYWLEQNGILDPPPPATPPPPVAQPFNPVALFFNRNLLHQNNIPAVPPEAPAADVDLPTVPVRVSTMPGSANGIRSSTNAVVTSLSNAMHQSDGQVCSHSKITLQVHRHLLDQHLLGRASVDDEDGGMQTSPVSLSADFFHPNISSRNLFSDPNPLTSAEPSAEVLMGSDVASAWDRTSLSEVAADPKRAGASPWTVGASQTPAHDTEFVELNDIQAELPTQIPPSPSLGVSSSQQDTSIDEAWAPSPRQHLVSILNYVDLEVYNSTSSSTKSNSDSGFGTSELKRHLTTRFSVYQRRLETLLAHGDSSGFDECLLDFWDEFMPLTANIHYYDRHTAVPRVSSMHRFLTRPCPKSIGVVQCEIERIKINSRRKGVSMKGRLFPMYEYRLFIRDRNHIHNSSENSSITDVDGTRKDTVLMIAKNRGRKHVEMSGSMPVSSSSKKGANNYYLYMPQQADVDTHYNKVNEDAEKTEKNANGASHLTNPSEEEAAPVLLGRLQSNFIGTEFQIFTPKVRKRRPRPTASRAMSEGHLSAGEDDGLGGYDSGFSSDNASSHSRRRSRFSLSLRRSSDVSLPHEETRSSFLGSSERPIGRPARTNRRAIASAVEVSEQQQSHPVLCEEEDGVITYTANLLGSRPRIMDVCIPKVSLDGCPGAEWKKFLEGCADPDDNYASNRMLNSFKLLQQRLENQEMDEGNQDNVENNELDPPEDFGLLALQNRPPWWNIELGSFVLNFRGRVSVASVKNFQLCDRNDHDHIMLQFGRIHGRHAFTMDFQYPLTAVQAFSIAISSLQSKISFG